jgi:hypothetical protein
LQENSTNAYIYYQSILPDRHVDECDVTGKKSHLNAGNLSL